MSNSENIITIDGPAGVGKSTVSRRVARECAYTYLDTGAMYRAVGLALFRAQLSVDDISAIEQFLAKLEIELISTKGGDTGVLLFGEDISAEIRKPEVSMLASRFSALAPVRSCLTELQRKIGAAGKVVAEGRDMGTVVFPLAKHKFYLDAEPAIRAQRRYDQMLAKGETADFSLLLEQTKQRDSSDKNRAISPLIPAADAKIIDTGFLSLDEVVTQILLSLS